MHRPALGDGEVEERLRAENRMRVVQERVLVLDLERLSDARRDDVWHEGALAVLEVDGVGTRDRLAGLDADEMDNRVAEMAGRVDDETLVWHALATGLLLLEDGLRWERREVPGHAHSSDDAATV
jgi:hypothetical protein